MKNLKVSIIITTYKRANMLERAINSVLNQTYKNIELIIVDDNNPCTEYRLETEKIMQKYSGDNRVIYIKHCKNKNGAVARNTGIQKCSGEIITFLDDDDYYVINKIELQLDYLIKNERFGAVYCGWDRNNKIVKPTLEGDLSLELLSGRNLIYTNCIMMWTSIAKDIGGWNENFKRNQEAVFLLRYFKKGYKIGVINDVLVKFDISDRSNALTGNKNEKQFNQFLSEHKDIIDKLDFERKGSKNMIYMWRYRCVFLSYLKNREFKNAFKFYVKVIRKMPLNFNYGLISYTIKKIIL